MATRQPLMAQTKSSLIPTKARGLEIRNGNKENGTEILSKPSVLTRGAAVAAVKAAVIPRRVGLTVLDKNTRRPAALVDQVKKLQTTLPEPKSEPKAVVTKRIPLSDTKSDKGFKTPDAPAAKTQPKDILSPDSYETVNIRDFLTDAEIKALPDPDGRDGASEFLCPEYIKDILGYLYERELNMPLPTNHMKDNKHLLPRHRRTLVDWLMQIHGRFRLTPETLYLTVYLIDLFVWRRGDVTTSRYQLVGITAMIIASKYEEVFPPSIDELAGMCDKAYSTSEVLRMERELLRNVDFEVGRPAPITFLRRYSKVADVDTEVHCMAKFLIELSVTEYHLVGVRPSKIAAAALFLGLKLDLAQADADQATPDCDHFPFWSKLVAYHSGYPAEVLVPVAYELCAVLVKCIGDKPGNHPEHHKHVFEKYAGSKVHRVSAHPLLKSRLVRGWAARAAFVSTPGSRPNPSSAASSASSNSATNSNGGKTKTPGKATASTTTTTIGARPKAVVVKRNLTTNVGVVNTSKSIATRPAFRP